MSNMFIKHQGKFDEAGIANICPLCGSKIDLSIAMTLEAEQDPNVVFTICPKCDGSIIISTVNETFGIAALAIATDLTLEDLYKFNNTTAISSNDILDLYAAFKSKPGVFEVAEK